MRKLKVVVRTAAGTLPLVVAAQVTPGCGESHRGSDEPAAGSGTVAGSNTAASGGSGGMPTGLQPMVAGQAAQSGMGAGTGAGTGAPAGGGGAGAGTMPAQPQAGSLGMAGAFEPPIRTDDPTSPTGSCQFIVELPEPGVPAEPGQICAATMLPVDSNRAATVRLRHDTTDAEGRTSLGAIEVEPALQELVVGTPTVELLEVTEPRLQGAEITTLDPEADGTAAFHIRWPENIYSFSADGMIRASFRVNLELRCDEQTQIVHSVTDVHLCGGSGTYAYWASSGDTCSVCRVIAEMAPSPIVPDAYAAGRGGLPLAQALRLRIVELARVSETVVLLAENDGGEGVDYQWQASHGRVQRLAPDVVAWSLSDRVEAPFIQAAVIGERGAAVSTFSFNDEAG